MWDTDKYINIMLYPFKQDENSEGVILGISHLPYTIKPDYLEGLNQLNGIPSHSSLKYPHCISINNTYINSTPSNESMMKDLIHVWTQTIAMTLQPMIEKHIAIGCKVISNQRTA